MRSTNAHNSSSSSVQDVAVTVVAGDVAVAVVAGDDDGDDDVDDVVARMRTCP